ncbi:hypothetical protein NTHI1209_00967 [Haemophilus influenzae]|uniref:Uncharacterized protein n=1 Tax=Haemophilus influenzae TaxID=727 RepID=A0A158SWW7_HAEIF|nr:hypothetical protein NTHI1209_00967 [Haemophilus influenzae]
MYIMLNYKKYKVTLIIGYKEIISSLLISYT